MSVLNPLRPFQKLPEHLKPILRLKALFYFDVSLQILRELIDALSFLSPAAFRTAVSAADFQAPTTSFALTVAYIVK